MNCGDFFTNMPVLGWIFIFLVLGVVSTFLLNVITIIKTKGIKIKDVEISSSQKEVYKTEGKSVLDNQTSNAHNLLKKIWIDLYETGRTMFHITGTQELFILEDIAHLIESKLNYEVKNDFARNYITEKNDHELTRYSDAKAIGYYRSVKASLYTYNVQLPNYDLPMIFNDISIDDYKKIFSEIYFSARKIAGGKGDD